MFYCFYVTVISTQKYNLVLLKIAKLYMAPNKDAKHAK